MSLMTMPERMSGAVVVPPPTHKENAQLLLLLLTMYVLTDLLTVSCGR